MSSDDKSSDVQAMSRIPLQNLIITGVMLNTPKYCMSENCRSACTEVNEMNDMCMQIKKADLVCESVEVLSLIHI